SDAASRTDGNGNSTENDPVSSGMESEQDDFAGGTGDADKSVRVPFNGRYGRYLDLDDDGIPYRTIPGTHETAGAFVTRGSSRDEYAVYTEDGDVYRRNMDRLMRKWDTAKELVPQPEMRNADGRISNIESNSESTFDIRNSKFAVIYFGTSKYAAEEALELLAEEGIHLDAMRVRAFPFGKAFRDFVDSHEQLFVIEQNRDAQFRSLMMIELGIDASRLISVLNYDGTPITADDILGQIKERLR
ncbi:MAG: hypothetical protein WBO10_02535, partial [Pyrinomonadaceae bacterium]